MTNTTNRPKSASSPKTPPVLRVALGLPVLALAFAAVIVGSLTFNALADRTPAATAAGETMAPPLAASAAVVNVEAVVNGSEELKAFNTRLEVEVRGMQVELDDLATQLETLQADFEELPAADREGRRSIRKKMFEVSSRAEVRKRILQNDIDVRKGEAVKLVYEKMIQAIATISQRDGIDVVMFDDRGIMIPEGLVENQVNQRIQARRVLYASEQGDITQRVLNLLNNNFAAGRSSRPKAHLGAYALRSLCGGALSLRHCEYAAG